MAHSENGDRGRTLAAISNRIAALQREKYGRGATKVRTIMDGDFVVCVMEDIYISAERTLIDGGRFDTVRETRGAFQDAMRPEFTAVVEELTGRRVIAFMSQNHADPDMAVEFFTLGDAIADGGSPALEETPAD